MIIKKEITVNFLGKEVAANIERGSLVPVFRVRDGRRRFMGWAERNAGLRGAVEIEFERDQMGNETTAIEFSKTDA